MVAFCFQNKSSGLSDIFFFFNSFRCINDPFAVAADRHIAVVAVVDVVVVVVGAVVVVVVVDDA